MYIQHEKVIDAVTVSAAYTGTAFAIEKMKDVAIGASWVGNLAGNIQLQVSLNGTDWYDKGSAVAAGGANGSTSWEIANNPWKLARINSSFSSGSSVLNAERCGKIYE